ncbi:MAG: DoxX family membrane protein [Candidatus Marinimicrobia bacterium]|nr:DoxX family membrane protein [Candidatus Neomarinimicrobiota bacterium]MCF7902551.1 DoxX family membrane protein [Candidatus Neomarinimicrobiota bacterium]
MKLNPVIGHLLRIILGGLFIYASLDSLWRPALFARAIYNYHLLPDLLLHPAAILLPWVEMITGIMLIANIFPRTSAAIQMVLLAVFTIAVSIAVARGLDINCGCFSLDENGTRTTVWKIGENVLLTALAFVVWFNARSTSPGLTPLQSMTQERE